MILNSDWILYPIEIGKKVSSPSDLVGYNSIPASVPGNVELDLIAANLLPENIFKGMNITLAEKYETYDWWYETTFITPDHERDVFLFFEGVDCFAEYWLNGKKIGTTCNSLIEHEFNITDYLNCINESNKLYVHIQSTLLKTNRDNIDIISLSDTGRHEYTAIRKQAHSWGWDIMPRALSAGIWKNVHIYEKDIISINQFHYTVTTIQSKKADMKFFWDLDIPDKLIKEDISVRIEGVCNSSVFSCETKAYYKSGIILLTLSDPLLWWPYGYGDANIYDTTIKVILNGEVVTSKQFNVGIRTLKLDRTSLTDGIKGKFKFIINGEDIMCRGTNWVSLDAYHSRDIQRYKPVLEMVSDLGCNIIRCWGGNVYEQDVFYDYCDRNGIMIWQDFGMACSIYSQSDDFCRQLSEEATKVIRRLRTHPSIILWSGDNECDQFFLESNINPNENILTRKILPEAVKLNDFSRPYLPSSPCFDELPGESSLVPSEEHLWGPRDYFKSTFYTQASSHFVSEIGYHGFPNIDSIKKFIDEEFLWPNTESEQWILHSSDQKSNPYRMRLARNQVSQFFGKEPDDMENFIKSSQYTQAEAKKYFIERIRCKKPSKTGVIWWNLIDGWPQVSDAIVDYYFSKKEAYEYIKRSQQPFVIIIDELYCNAHKIMAVNDTLNEVCGSYKIYNIDTESIYSKGKFNVMPNGILELDKMKKMYSDKEFLVIEWTLDNKKYYNHYLCGMPAFDYNTYKIWITKFKSLIKEY